MNGKPFFPLSPNCETGKGIFAKKEEEKGTVTTDYMILFGIELHHMILKIMYKVVKNKSIRE